jgi:hypothetical protein
LNRSTPIANLGKLRVLCSTHPRKIFIHQMGGSFVNESKIVVTERLRREGRWAEASKFKDAAAADFRSSGMSRTEANEAAWNATAEKFPPSSPERAERGGGPQDDVSAVSPPIPWGDLPTEAHFDDEVRWVHQQYILIVEDSPSGRIIHWDRATTEPPSTGACSLALWAADNRTAFYKDLLPKTIAKAGGGSRELAEQIAEEEERGISDVEALLKQVEDEMDAKLRANVPSVLQQRVSETLNDWARRYAVSLESEALAQLDSGICRLIKDSLGAFSQQ